MRLGVDLGTTWTAAAVDATTGPEAVQLAERTIAMPSVVAVADGSVLVGEAAEAHLADHPASGTREFKRRLGDSTPYVLDGTPFGAEALMGHLLRHAIERAESQIGEEVGEIVLTHPANWGSFKLDLLAEVARIAGVEDRMELQPEPVAAVRHHLALGGVAPGQAVAAFDFGGGTVDVAVVRTTDDGLEVLGAPEGLERLGGVDVDQIVLAHVDAVLDGQLRELDTTDPAVRRAITQLRLRCTAAKEALSAETETTIAVQVPGLDTQVRLSRAELESALRPRLDDAVAALHRAAKNAELDAADLDAVVLVGGSSRIPLVAEMIAAAAGAPVVPGADPQLAIAAGAAVSGTDREAGDTATSDEDAPEAAAAAAPGDRPTEPGRRERPAPSRRDRQALRRLVTGGAMAASAAGAAVGGYLAYQRWWDGDDDGEQRIAEADLVAAAADEPEVELDVDAAVEAVSGGAEALLAELGPQPALDAFDDAELAAPAGPAPGPPVGSPIGFSAASAPVGPPPAAPAASFSAAAPAPPPQAPSRSPRPEPAAPTSEPTPGPRPAPPATDPIAASRPTPAPADAPVPPIFSDPELESVRDQLRDRLSALELPEGTDPADADRLRRDLEGLLDRYRAAPGQSVDEAVASLRYEFEDRMRDFAQDQRIDALIEQARDEDEATEATEPADEATDEATGEAIEPADAATDETTDLEAAPPIVADVFDELPPDDHDGADDHDVEDHHDHEDDHDEADHHGHVDDGDEADHHDHAADHQDEVEAAATDDVFDDVLGTEAVEPPLETDPLILTAPGVGVPEPADDPTEGPGRLTKDLIPEVVDAAPAPEDEIFTPAIVPGGEFLDQPVPEPAPEPVPPAPDVDDDVLDSPLGV
ncbi:MAG: Hsp70 family protein [Actinomycetota bacterium]